MAEESNVDRVFGPGFFIVRADNPEHISTIIARAMIDLNARLVGYESNLGPKGPFSRLKWSRRDGQLAGVRWPAISEVRKYPTKR